MQNTAEYQQYWSTVVDLTVVVYLYKIIEEIAVLCNDRSALDELEDFIRDKYFPDMVNRARQAYYACDQLPRLSFGMLGEEIDLFFHELIMHPEYLDKLYHRAFEYLYLATPACPLYIALGEIKGQAK